MTSCKHTSWVRLSKKKHLFTKNTFDYQVQISDRGEVLLESLPHADTEYVSFILFIGNEGKSRALTNIGIDRLKYNNRAHGEAHLFLAPDKEVGFPLLIADMNMPLHNRISRPGRDQKCHESSTHSITDRSIVLENPLEVADTIYQRMLVPFADIVCFFVNDLGGCDRILRRIAMWSETGIYPKPSPWLVLIVQEVEQRNYLEKLKEFNTNKIFKGVRVYCINSARYQTRVRDRSTDSNELKYELRELLRRARAEKQKKGLLFSARHLAGFFNYIRRNPPFNQKEPLNLIAVSRSDHPVSNELGFHLENFLDNFQSPDLLQKFAIPTIASCLILDQYPPGMHCKRSLSVFKYLTHKMFLTPYIKRPRKMRMQLTKN
ncbi:hypothetical protein GGTG_13472 [Gaeumannomyces tritici R3-111a-1]|uniref:Uncharacterized protein n=1 Tax=Gaeumannomyces tritici (strain R3-111a-1) TaxID=644352 RepID=J3PIZ2_GAET3|nr:hypothetical protein GGTG_13472 [Gaeumannomyces tritici R3-111a-1]EJT68966.1 hypothetical protein GGTG_13472 [Gaeumannomyces tritici R3-111a-1]